jgi:hypothetical protein
MTADGQLPQGDLRLLETPLAQRLLGGAYLARLAYVALDQTPRVIPVGFVWNGTEVVVASFVDSPKHAALRARPSVALSIDLAGPPPEVLSIRGMARVEEVQGVPAEYRQMQERYYGPEQATAAVATMERAGARMSRVAITPTWVGVLDFQTRLPRAVARLAAADPDSGN